MREPFVALIPVNRLDRAKGRLAEVLAADQRQQLTLATTRTVIEAVVRAGGHPVVLTADATVERQVRDTSEILHEEPGRHGLNGQIEYAREVLACDELLLLHADLPLATGEAIQALVEGAPPPPSATITRSGDGGTNALFLRPPGLFPLRYGPDSAELHRQAAHAARVVISFRAEPALKLDLDTPADIEALMEFDPRGETRAGHLLRTWGITGKLA